MKILTLLIATSFSLCILSCSSASSTSAQSKNDTTSQAKTSASQTSSSTSSKGKTDSSLASSLAGTWEMVTEKDSTLTFDKDGNFTSIDKSGSDKGTYSIVDNETIEIKSPKMPPNTKFKAKIEGDTLNMTMDGMAEPMVLKRTK